MPTCFQSTYLLTPIIVLCLATLNGCQLLSGHTQPTSEQTLAITPAEQQQAQQAAQRIFSEYSDWRIEQSPVLASQLGIRGQFDWDDISSEAQELRLENLQQFRSRLKALNETALSPTDAASYHTLLERIENQMLSAPLYLLQEPLADRNNWLLITESVFLNHHPINNIEDAHDYIARVNALPQLINRWNEYLQRRQKAGYLSPHFAYQDNIEKLNTWLKHAPFIKSSQNFSVWQDFQQKIKRLGLYPSSEKLLRNKMQQALKNSAEPAYRALLKQLKEQNAVARDLVGLSQRPQGLRYYQLRLQRQAETNMDAHQVFQLAQAQVTHIQQKIRSTAVRQGWKTDNNQQNRSDQPEPFRALIPWLRQQRHYFNREDKSKLNKAAVLGYQRQYIQQLSGRLPYHFTHIPETPLALTHGKNTVHFYHSSDAAFSYIPGINQQPAQLRWNPDIAVEYSTDQLKTASAIYAIPGLHMQIALAQENNALPDFRRQPYLAEFNPGWLLFSRELAQQILPTDSTATDLALLQYKLQLLIRVVVDCGVHTKQWSHLQAIEYISNNSTTSTHQATLLINQIMLQPTQAAAEYFGYQNLIELQQKLTLKHNQLLPDSAFDKAAFHSELLRQGAVPLDVLENSMQRWLSNLIQQKQYEMDAARKKAS